MTFNLSSTNNLANIFLEEAQEMFGDKILGWEFSGIEIGRKPSLKYYPLEGQVAIVLSENVKENAIQLAFELSHEVCHLLHPSMNHQTMELYATTFMNEGVATFFQIHIMEMTELLIDKEPMVLQLKDHSLPYYKAYCLVQELLSIDPEIIKNLRKIEPRIDFIQRHHFATLDLPVPEDLIGNLIKPFEDRDPIS